MKKKILWFILIALVVSLIFIISIKYVDYDKLFNKKEYTEEEPKEEITTTNDRTNDHLFIKKTNNDKNDCKRELLLDDLTIKEVKEYNKVWHTSRKKTLKYNLDLINLDDNFTNYSLYFSDDYIYICDIDINKCDKFKYKVDDYKYNLYDIKTDTYSDDANLYHVDYIYKLFIYNEDDKLIDIYYFDNTINS